MWKTVCVRTINMTFAIVIYDHTNFKVILDSQMNEAIAFILPHRKISTSELPLFITTVDDVEEATNLNFFNVIPDSIEEDMEQQNWEMW